VPGQDGTDAVSLAGLLALGSYPQEGFPQLMVTFVRYPTVTGAQSASGERFLDNVALEGPVPVMARDTLAAIRRNMSRRAVIADAGRQDIWEYPETALREAIVNALVHRDLSGSARGTRIQVEMYPDRLVIRNPGGLFGPVTIARELVTQAGTRRWAQYRLPLRLGSRASGTAARANRRAALLTALGDETLSRAELAARTGLNDQTVRRWLTIMRDEGSVELAGTSPRSTSARYRRARQGSLFPPGEPEGASRALTGSPARNAQQARHDNRIPRSWPGHAYSQGCLSPCRP
jgi:predicted HTH transcriptional regulator